MTGGKTTVAVLDDEAKMRSALARLLRGHGYAVELFESCDDFLTSTGRAPADCLLLDLHMPKTTGFDLLDAMSSMHIHMPTIVITGNDEPGNVERARMLGAEDYLTKPIDESTLVAAIERVCSGAAKPPDRPQ